MSSPHSADSAHLEPRLAEVTWRETDDGIVLLDHATWKYRRLNASGSLLWQTLVEGATVAQLERALIDRYGLPAQAASTDVEAFLQELEASGLLRR